MSQEDHEAVQERLKRDTYELGQLWSRLAADMFLGQQLDAVYLPGLSVGMIESCDLFGLVAHTVKQTFAQNLAFNGSDGRGAGPSSGPGDAWPGATWYREEFISRKVPEAKLCPTRPGIHTRDETDAFVELAKEKGWTTAYIATVPYHWPRILSCLVGSMAKCGYRMKLWLLPLNITPNWDHPMIGSQGQSTSTYRQEAYNDVGRYIMYVERGREDNGQAWRQHYGAPPEEIHRYLDWRDNN